MSEPSLLWVTGVGALLTVGGVILILCSFFLTLSAQMFVATNIGGVLLVVVGGFTLLGSIRVCGEGTGETFKKTQTLVQNV